MQNRGGPAAFRHGQIAAAEPTSARFQRSFFSVASAINPSSASFHGCGDLRPVAASHAPARRRPGSRTPASSSHRHSISRASSVGAAPGSYAVTSSTRPRDQLWTPASKHGPKSFAVPPCVALRPYCGFGAPPASSPPPAPRRAAGLDRPVARRIREEYLARRASPRAGNTSASAVPGAPAAPLPTGAVASGSSASSRSSTLSIRASSMVRAALRALAGSSPAPMSPSLLLPPVHCSLL